MIQHHQAVTAQQAAVQHYYYQQHIAHQNRLPVHPTTIHAPVQVQVPSHQTPGGHGQQQTSQHNPNIPHVPQQQQQQPTTNSAQMANRTEGAPSAVAERKRKILKIVDPTTGIKICFYPSSRFFHMSTIWKSFEIN